MNSVATELISVLWHRRVRRESVQDREQGIVPVLQESTQKNPIIAWFDQGTGVDPGVAPCLTPGCHVNVQGAQKNLSLENYILVSLGFFR